MHWRRRSAELGVGAERGTASAKPENGQRPDHRCHEGLQRAAGLRGDTSRAREDPGAECDSVGVYSDSQGAKGTAT